MGTGSRQLPEPVRVWGLAPANFSRQVPVPAGTDTVLAVKRSWRN
ncbi:hypothetical protein L494_0077 [Bordetella bronchiseptica CA90 BB1334]|nr:hypothetical protein L576_0101 [Bordetella bronchiseptica OSU054]KDB74192.1 hypothetical protein L494_0077 [Bordetella bronchiseptica CA90 BB1334]KDD45376.1 hypothetical protein L532_5297 [Bordetella bronchiseptica OSU095]